MENGDKISVHERLATLETKTDSILKNHLPHIQKTIDKLSNKFWAIILLLLSNLVGLVIGLTYIIIKL